MPNSIIDHHWFVFFCDFENIYRLSFLDSWKYFCLFLLHLKYCDKYMERYDRTWSFMFLLKIQNIYFYTNIWDFKQIENSYYWTHEHPEGSFKGQIRVKLGSNWGQIGVKTSLLNIQRPHWQNHQKPLRGRKAVHHPPLMIANQMALKMKTCYLPTGTVLWLWSILNVRDVIDLYFRMTRSWLNMNA